MRAEEKGTVLPSQEGQRLDRALELFFPELGLRARRRLCERASVLVDGLSARPGFRVRGGQKISTIPTRDRWDATPLAEVRVVSRTPQLAAVYKPKGLHTARLAGSEAPCVEERLPDLLGPVVNGYPMLVNRLDHETSGLVAVAMDAAGAEQWLAVENSGLVQKNYLAVVHGAFTAPATIKMALDTADRRISRPLPDAPHDPLRFTHVTPLAQLETFSTVADMPLQGPFTLVGCRIRKGARHQIRAHLSLHDAPLVGDTLYGSPLPGPFFLHHASFFLDDLRVQALPDWFESLPEQARNACRNWLELVPKIT